MEKEIESFLKQLKFKPKIKNKKNLIKAKKFIVSGMGGSHLAADLLKNQNPALDLTIHPNYDLPNLPENLKNYLIIISSYSGNTKEPLSSFRSAVKKGFSVACISTGGELLKLAQKYKKPYIKIPDTEIEPRSALGFSLISFLTIMGKKKLLSEVASSTKNIKPKKLKRKGQALAKKLNNYIPIIYSSEKNKAVVYNWKIRLNETGKTPSFYNVFPELCHNEIESFQNSKNFYFIFLKDKTDHPRIILRMKALKKILKKKRFPVELLELKGNNFWEKALSSILIADWTAYFTAKQYNFNPKETKIIDKFKKMIR